MNAPASLLAQLPRSWARMQPDAPALVCTEEVVSWRRLANRIERASARLATEWGVEPGDRIACLALNRPETLYLLFALAALGAVLVPLNYRLAPAELESILKDAGCRLLLADATHATVATTLCAGDGIAMHQLSELIATPCDARFEAPLVRGDAPVLLVYTSGTTGEPRGVVHSQDGLLWNAQASIAAHAMTDQDRVLTVLPLFHVGGLCIQTLPALVAGATVVLHARFAATDWIDTIARESITLSLMVPATLSAVLACPQWRDAQLSSLRLVMAGSSMVPVALIEAFGLRNIAVGQVYGATETGPVSVVLRREHAGVKRGFAGWPALHTRVRLVKEGADVSSGEVGEIWLKGRNCMIGYWNGGAIDPLGDAWFQSGDLARADSDGCLEVVGRARDMIITGGENIYPAEIERILLQQAGVQEATVIGWSHRQWGEVPVAAVVLASAAAHTEAGLKTACSLRLARFKIPHAIVFVEQIPKTALGKPQKAAVIELLRQSSPGLGDL